MDQRQREILISRRVELVENLDMTGGLYTRLLAKKILNQRKVNEFKLQRTPEAQAEELLSYLPKKDCFDAFCEALIADDQEDIVEKYLKLPSKKLESKGSTSEPCTDTQDLTSTSLLCQEGTSSGVTDKETPDCAISPKKRDINYVAHHTAPSSPVVLCIKESDEKHVYIKYNNPPSPAKRQKMLMDSCATGVVLPYNAGDNTRYAMKHYISNEDEVVDSGGQNLPLHHSNVPNYSHIRVLENQQSKSQNNIPSNPFHVAAFARQQAEKPYESSINFHSSGSNINPTPSSPLKLKDPVNENAYVSPSKPEFEAQDRTSNLSGRHNKAFFQHLEQKTMTDGSLPVKNSQYFANESFQSNSLQFLDPQKYLHQTGILPTFKGASEIQHQTFDSSGLFNGDTLDTMAPFQSLSGDLSQIHGGARSHLQLNASALGNDNCELEIDLPDGCVTVKVEHSTRQFFLNNFKKSYPMRQIPRGLALVINVDEVEGKPPRKGTNFDRDNLCNLLTQLHFNIVVYNDNDGLSAQEMVNKLKAFAKLKEHYSYDACFICLLSHGEEGYIFGTDGKRIPLEEIFMLFGNTNCKGLIGKPKMFIIQACRGGTLDKGVKMDDEPDGGSIPTKAPAVQQLPSLSDMLICYPTLMGYYAWRNRARGSWYIEAIVQVFMRYAKNEDICTMLNRVNQVVSKKVSECNQKEMNQMSQMSEYKSTLRQPHLFLFPGIGCANVSH